MVSRKYVKDYHIDEQYNPVTGRLKSVPVYTGAWYTFKDPAAAARTKVIYYVLSALIFAAYCVFLGVNAPCVHIWYCTVPLILMMLEVIHLLAGDIRLVTARDKVIHEHRDKIVERFRRVTIILMLCCILGLSGHIVYSALTGDVFLDYIIYAAVIVILVCAFCMYCRLDTLDMVETEAPDAPSASEQSGN